MGPGEGDFVVSGKESGPSFATQRTGEKLCGSCIFPVPPGLFLQRFLFLSHVPDSSVGALWVRGRKLGQPLASEDTVSPWQPLPLWGIGLVPASWVSGPFSLQSDPSLFPPPTSSLGQGFWFLGPL